MRSGAQLPGNGESTQLERVGREDPLGAAQAVRACVHQGVAGGRPHAPAEVGQSITDLLGESTVVTSQVAGVTQYTGSVVSGWEGLAG